MGDTTLLNGTEKSDLFIYLLPRFRTHLSRVLLCLLVSIIYQWLVNYLNSRTLYDNTSHALVEIPTSIPNRDSRPKVAELRSLLPSASCSNWLTRPSVIDCLASANSDSTSCVHYKDTKQKFACFLSRHTSGSYVCCVPFIISSHCWLAMPPFRSPTLTSEIFPPSGSLQCATFTLSATEGLRTDSTTLRYLFGFQLPPEPPESVQSRWYDHVEFCDIGCHSQPIRSSGNMTIDRKANKSAGNH